MDSDNWCLFSIFSCKSSFGSMHLIEMWFLESSCLTLFTQCLMAKKLIIVLILYGDTLRQLSSIASSFSSLRLIVFSELLMMLRRKFSMLANDLRIVIERFILSSCIMKAVKSLVSARIFSSLNRVIILITSSLTIPRWSEI